jgi:hypothetical protein
MEPIGGAGTSVVNQLTLRNNPGDGSIGVILTVDVIREMFPVFGSDSWFL